MILDISTEQTTFERRRDLIAETLYLVSIDDAATTIDTKWVDLGMAHKKQWRDAALVAMAKWLGMVQPKARARTVDCAVNSIEDRRQAEEVRQAALDTVYEYDKQLLRALREKYPWA